MCIKVLHIVKIYWWRTGKSSKTVNFIIKYADRIYIHSAFTYDCVLLVYKTTQIVSCRPAGDRNLSLYIYCPTKHAICPLNFNLEFLLKTKINIFSCPFLANTNVQVLKKLSDFLFLFLYLYFIYFHLSNNQHTHWIKRGGGRTFLHRYHVTIGLLGHNGVRVPVPATVASPTDPDGVSKIRRWSGDVGPRTYSIELATCR